MLRGQLHFVPVSNYKNKPYHSRFKWKTCSLCENQFRNESGQVCTIEYSDCRIRHEVHMQLDYKYDDNLFGYYWDDYYFCSACTSKFSTRIKDFMEKQMEEVLIMERCEVKPLEEV